MRQAQTLPKISAPAERRRSHPSGTPLRVLAVDDCAVNLKLISSLLRKLGYEIETAQDGWQAVQAFEPGKFHLIIMDWQMPVMNGHEATRAIRAIEAGQGSKSRAVIVGHSSSETPEQCLWAGTDDFLPKPATGRMIRDVIARWFH